MRRAALAVYLFGCGVSGGSVPALAQEANPQATVLHLSETAGRPVTRDLLRVELRVEETGTVPQGVQVAINRRMAAALDRARQVQGVRIETGAYGIDQERTANGPARWRGSQSLILKGKEADAILKLVGILQADGLATAALNYEASPETIRGVQDELTAEALAALDRRAASIAGTMHLQTLRYRDLRVGNAESADRPVPRFAAMSAAAAPVAEPGETVLRVTVEAELLLGSPRP